MIFLFLLFPLRKLWMSGLVDGGLVTLLEEWNNFHDSLGTSS